MIVEDENGQNIYLDRMDRPEPSEPPDLDRPPFDLDAVAGHYHEALGEDMSGIPWHSKVALAAVPELVAELRAAREELAEWRALPYRDEYAVYRPCAVDCDCEGSRSWFNVAERTLAAAERLAGQPQTRRIYTGPWAELQAPPY